MEESNKTLALLLVAAIVVSLGGTIISLNRLGQLELGSATGRVVTEGTATVTINQTAVVDLTDNVIAFGEGSLNPGNDSCTLSSNETVGLPTNCGTWNWTVNSPDKIVFENAGSATIDVTVGADADAAGFIGGTTPGFKYVCYDSESETGSETYTGADTWLSFTGAGGQPCVQSLLAASASDAAGMKVQVTVGLGAAGAKTATLTFVATAS